MARSKHYGILVKTPYGSGRLVYDRNDDFCIIEFNFGRGFVRCSSIQNSKESISELRRYMIKYPPGDWYYLKDDKQNSDDDTSGRDDGGGGLCGSVPNGLVGRLTATKNDVKRLLGQERENKEDERLCHTTGDNIVCKGKGDICIKGGGYGSGIITTSAYQPADNDRVEAFLSRMQHTSEASTGYKNDEEKTTIYKRDIRGWTFDCLGSSWGLAIGAVMVMMSVVLSFSVGYRFGTASVDLQNSYVQLTQLKFEEALSHFERGVHIADDMQYKADFEKLLTNKADESVQMFVRSTGSLGILDKGNKLVEGMQGKLQSTLLKRQLLLATDNAVRGLNVVEDEWEFDDRTIDTGLDQCRCRAVLMNRSARQKMKKANGDVVYSDWADHGQIGQCTWKETTPLVE